MSVRRSVDTKIWSDEWIEKLSVEEKLLWIYLLTNSKTNMLGIYEISVNRISFETGLSSETILKAFKSFERVNKAFYVLEKYIFLPNWIKNQSMNKNMHTSARNEFIGLAKELNDSVLSIINGESFKTLSNPFKSFGTLPNRAIPKMEGEGEKELEGEGEGGNKTLPPPVPVFFSTTLIASAFENCLNGRGDWTPTKRKQQVLAFYDYYIDSNLTRSKGDVIKNEEDVLKAVRAWIKKDKPESNYNHSNEPSKKLKDL